MRGSPLKVQQKPWENGTQVVVKGKEADGVLGLGTLASATLDTRLGFSLRGAIPEAELEQRGVGAGS